MLPDLTVLVALILGLSFLAGGTVDPWLAVLGTLASVCVAGAMTWMAGERGVRAVREGEAGQIVAAARWAQVWPLLGWVAAVLFFEWGTFVGTFVPRTLWLGRFVVLFLPSAVLFAVSWRQHGRIEVAAAAARGAVLPPESAIRQGLRRNGIALLPMAVIIGLLEGIWLLGELGAPGLKTFARWLEVMPLLTLGVMLAALALLTVFLPALFRRLLATEPLPPGPLRSLLERHAAALALRYRELLVWKTRGLSFNAMVVGFTPRTRLVFFTDALLRHLPEEEVLAVFAHEAGHAKRHHLPLFLVLFVTTAVLFQVGGDVLEAYGVEPFFVMVAHLAFLWFVLLGTVSRLFEREADAFGADHATRLAPQAEGIHVPGLAAPLPAGAAYMIRALERIRRLSGRGASHRHGTIDSRVHFVAAHATDPRTRRGFAMRLRRLHLIVIGTTVLAAAAAAWRLPGDLALARAWLRAEDGVRAYETATRRREAGAADAEVRRLWEQAHADFRASLRHLGGRDDARARGLRLQSTFHAAQVSVHGLEDEGSARGELEETLAYAARSGLPGATTRPLRFHTHVDLGRVLAHAHDPEALATWNRARVTLPRGSSEGETYGRARLQLLRAVLLARVEAALRHVAFADVLGLLASPLRAHLGDVEGAARRWLEGLAERAERGADWDELRRDASAELGRLPPGA